MEQLFSCGKFLTACLKTHHYVKTSEPVKNIFLPPADIIVSQVTLFELTSTWNVQSSLRSVIGNYITYNVCNSNTVILFS